MWQRVRVEVYGERFGVTALIGGDKSRVRQRESGVESEGNTDETAGLVEGGARLFREWWAGERNDFKGCVGVELHVTAEAGVEVRSIAERFEETLR